MKLLPVAVKAFTEDDFLSWDKKTQEQWLKEHPDSKFAELKGKSGGKKKSTDKAVDTDKLLAPVKQTKEKKPKLSDEEKKAESEKKFQEAIKDKSEEDKKAFIAARKDGVAIPPAWNNITYNKKPVEGVIASGTDAKGRKQRLEDPEWRTMKIREKHERIAKDLEPIFDDNVKKLRTQAKEGNVEAQVLYLITQTAFRIGGEGDGKAKEKAYGASTLLGKHAKVDGNTVTFDFIGKEGVRQVHTIKDPVIAKYVSGRGGEERLFPTSEEKIRKHWKSMGGYKVHDIRSLLATRLAKRKLDELIPPPPKDEKELNKVMAETAKVASEKLGNRPSEALNTYISHTIFPVVGEK